jgi:hypothetical protein
MQNILGCFQEYYKKRQDSVTLCGGLKPVYISADNYKKEKEVCTLNFILLKNQYLGLCMCFF